MVHSTIEQMNRADPHTHTHLQSQSQSSNDVQGAEQKQLTSELNTSDSTEYITEKQQEQYTKHIIKMVIQLIYYVTIIYY